MPAWPGEVDGKAASGYCLARKDLRTMGVERPRPVWYRFADAALEGASHGVWTLAEKGGCRSRGHRSGARARGACLRVSSRSWRREARCHRIGHRLARESRLVAARARGVCLECPEHYGRPRRNALGAYHHNDGSDDRFRHRCRSQRLNVDLAGGCGRGRPHLLFPCPQPSTPGHWVS